MTSVQLVRSDRLAPAPSAYAATAPADSRVIQPAGACPLHPDGTTAAVGDVAGQARTCLANLEIALDAAGARLTDVIGTRILVATQDRAELVAAWDVVAAHFGEHDVPSTLVGVAVLGYPDQLVEIEAVAAVVDGRPG
jgi:enamine deaminase RidA (YjgF/YER057c/UK114 family)